MQKRHFDKINIIGYDCGWGCRDYGCEDGPDAIDFAPLLQELQERGFQASWDGSLDIKNLADHAEFDTKEKTFPLVVEAVTRLAKATSDILDKNGFPIIIGGDHSSAIGTWSAATTTLEAENKFGLIWFDAHMDSHTPETADEGKWGGWWHAMPASSLIGDGKREFTHLCSDHPKISPEHISLIGVRSYEPGEEAFLKDHNVHVYKMEEIEERGFTAVFQDALKRATDGTDGFGLSIDLDGFCPRHAPGVGTAEEYGLQPDDVLAEIKGLASNPLLRAMEIVEYNPHHGQGGVTQALIQNLILSVFEEKS